MQHLLNHPTLTVWDLLQDSLFFSSLKIIPCLCMVHIQGIQDQTHRHPRNIQTNSVAAKHLNYVDVWMWSICCRLGSHPRWRSGCFFWLWMDSPGSSRSVPELNSWLFGFQPAVSLIFLFFFPFAVSLADRSVQHLQKKLGRSIWKLVSTFVPGRDPVLQPGDQYVSHAFPSGLLQEVVTSSKNVCFCFTPWILGSGSTSHCWCNTFFQLHAEISLFCISIFKSIFIFKWMQQRNLITAAH